MRQCDNRCIHPYNLNEDPKMKKLDELSKGDLILYQTEDGEAKIEVKLIDETLWLSLNQIADAFDRDKSVISKHISNIYEEGELVPERTVAKYATVQREGQREVERIIEFYNLDMIIAIGYRVKSSRGTQFRIWATNKLKEYLVKGFVMDDERLKNVSNIGSDYFDEMLERIKDIRSSEKRFYQKIRDIYKLAVDYDPKSKETLEFFKIVQNKLHFAISGKTAAEIIADRADSSKPNMGLTTWKGKKVRSGDVTIAKNYLNEKEMAGLNRIVTMYLDYAEDQAKLHHQIFMRDWRKKLDAFLQFNERDILNNAGKISKEVVDELALQKYELFNQNRLVVETKKEALADDEELKILQKNIEKAEKKKKKK